MLNEAKAKLAGQVAAADAICEHADRMQARDVTRLLARIDRAQRTRRAGKAVH